MRAAAAEPQSVIGIPHLRQLWSRVRAELDHVPRPDANDASAAWDGMVIRGLGLGLTETHAFLYARPSFEAFEQWIVAMNGGSVDSRIVARINAARAGETVDPIDVGEPALGAEELAFFDEHGYVVLRNAVMPAAARAAEDAIWEFLAMDRDDPSTWYAAAHEGIWVPLVHHPALDANRASPRLASAFAQLWGRRDLSTTVDRCSFNPPVRPGWHCPAPGLHWDVNLTPPIPFGLSAILYLVDTAADQGAFTCVPGFHRRIDGWLRSLPDCANPRQADLSGERTVSVAADAGDLVIWHHALPHCATPNRAARPRIAQYIAMSPCTPEPAKVWR